MILNQSTPPGFATSPAPEDLRRLIGRRLLVDVVCGAVGDCLAHRAGSCGSEKLLALLTYSYAAGIYASDEIPRELQQDDLFRLLRIPAVHDHHVLRRFRRHNRSALRDCLSRVLLRARWTFPPRSGEWTHPQGSWMLSARCEREADTRIERAVRADAFALDE